MLFPRKTRSWQRHILRPQTPAVIEPVQVAGINPLEDVREITDMQRLTKSHYGYLIPISAVRSARDMWR